MGLHKFGRSPLILGLLLLVIGCEGSDVGDDSNNATSSDTSDTSAAIANNCPATDPNAALFDTGDYDIDMFVFAPEKTSAEADTVTFDSPSHRLVFCRADASWAVLPSTLPLPSEDFDDSTFEDLTEGKYETIEANGSSYQYRTMLDPNPFPDYTTAPEKVRFDLIPSGETAPISLDLYTLSQLEQSGIGFDLGVPMVNAAVQIGYALFFIVSAEQGEGFNGLISLVRYDLQTNSLAKTQPINIIAEQITDLEVTTNGDQVTFWMGTKYSVEGSSSVPAKGLVTYSFTEDAWDQGKTTAYSVHNSPLVGSIPTDLHLDGDRLWVSTGSGICQFPWQQVQSWDAWDCWEFSLEAEIPEAGIPLYNSLLATTPITTLTPNTEGEKTPVYWWSSLAPQGFEEDAAPRIGRFEVAYPAGLRVTVPEGGYRWENADSIQPDLPWETDVYWPGRAWHWEGDRFVRSFDEVDINYITLGATGISERGYSDAGIQDVNVMRGDINLISLTNELTQMEYFSGWVDDELISPSFVVIPSERSQSNVPNPVKEIAPNLEEF